MAERLLKVRTRQKSKKPEFNFHDSHKKKRLGTSWRKPRGLHNKLRQQVAAKGKLVRVGYGSPKAVRGFHPCGLPEMLVNNVAELEKAQGAAVRIASGVGMKKRQEIQTKAAAAGIKVLNPKGGA
jgi:large subunit ribosomal protein L32e